MALRVGHEKLTARPAGSRASAGRKASCRTIRWYAENRDGWIGRVDWLPTRIAAARARGEPRRRARLARRGGAACVVGIGIVALAADTSALPPARR